MPHVVEINCLEHLQAHRLAWSSLWRRTKRADITQTLEWFTAYCRNNDAVIRPRALLVMGERDEVLGILPLVVREEATAIGTLRVLGYPLALGLHRCGAVGNQVSLTLQTGLKHIAESPRDWAMLDLQGIDGDELDGRRTIAGLRLAELDAELDLACEHAVIRWDEDWEAYRGTREPQRRGLIEQAEQRLDGRADAVHVRYRPAGAMHGDDAPRWDLYADCLTVARRSRTATSLGPSPIAPAQAELFRAAHLAAIQVGALDLNVLYLDENPAAFAYNYLVDGAVTVVAAGSDPRYAQDDVGSVLIWAMLRQSYALGDRTIDLGPANGGSAFWQTNVEQRLQAVHYPRRALRAQALRIGRMWGRRLSRPARFAATF